MNSISKRRSLEITVEKQGCSTSNNEVNLTPLTDSTASSDGLLGPENFFGNEPFVAPPTINKCSACGVQTPWANEKWLVCPGSCHRARYCSRDCQIWDWENGGHSVTCEVAYSTPSQRFHRYRSALALSCKSVAPSLAESSLHTVSDNEQLTDSPSDDISSSEGSSFDDDALDTKLSERLGRNIRGTGNDGPYQANLSAYHPKLEVFHDVSNTQFRRADSVHDFSEVSSLSADHELTKDFKPLEHIECPAASQTVILGSNESSADPEGRSNATPKKNPRSSQWCQLIKQHGFLIFVVLFLMLFSISIFVPIALYASQKRQSSQDAENVVTPESSAPKITVPPKFSGQPSAAPTFSGKAATSSPTMAFSPGPNLNFTGNVTDAVRGLLSGLYTDGTVPFLEQDTPQNRAFSWLVGNYGTVSMPDEQTIQRYVLATFYHSTLGDGWVYNDNWLSEQDECEWFSNAWPVCDEWGKYVSLNLDFNNVGGELPTELGWLTSLTRISLIGGPTEMIAGKLPTDLGRLSGLSYLNLKGNNFFGGIPSGYGSLSAIQTLDLSFNQLSGSVPKAITNMLALEVLVLTNNKFDSSLPSEIGNLGNLVEIRINDNDITGPLPSSLGNLSKLADFHCDSNSFSSFPFGEIGSMQLLQRLVASNNNITGQINLESGSLAGLQVLNLNNNSLDGSIPMSIFEMQSLEYLDLSGNRLVGALPMEIKNLRGLVVLKLSSNELTGEVPHQIAELNAIQTIELETNNLTSLAVNLCDDLQRAAPSLDVFVADCGGDQPELECSCCTSCCTDNKDCVS